MCRGSVCATSVMPGLVPGIHVFSRTTKDVDGRDEPGHDETSSLHSNVNHASNMITLRSVLPAFMLAKPSLISESFSLAEIQSSRCSLPRM